MQRFINNWATTLQSPLGAADGQLLVPADKAALLVGLGAGDTYLLTLVEVDGTGAEVAWEIVTASANASGQLTVARAQESTMARAWPVGTPISARLTAGALSEVGSEPTWGEIVGTLADQADLAAALAGKATAAQGAKADSAVQPADLAPVATSGSYSDLTSKPFIPTTPGDIGAATAAQGDKADTAVQPAALATALDAKVDKLTGYGLSQENFTAAEKAKLAGLESSSYKGTFVNLAALQAAHPTAEAGAYADVDAGASDPVLRYIWDNSDSEWVAQAGSADPVTAAQVKTLYESNADTNAFTDAEQSKLAGVEADATANPDTDSLLEGATNQWFTAARVRAVVLTGLSLATNAAVAATDTVLEAFGKLQRQINELGISVAGKLSNPMTAAGDLIVGGASGAAVRLPKGSDGKVLKLVTGAPAWADEAGGADNTYATASVVSGVLALDLTTASTFGVQLTEGVTALTLAGAVPGVASRIDVIFAQPLDAAWAVATPSGVILPVGQATLVSEVAGDITLISLVSVNNGVSWYAERRGVFSAIGAPTLPTFTGENESFLDEGGATTGWTTDYGSPTLTSVNSNLHLVGGSCAVRKTLSAPASGDFITYFKIKGSQASGQYWSVYFTQGATLHAVFSFGYDWVAGAATSGVISLYGQGGAQKKVLKTGADYTQYVEIALHQDIDRSVINVYMKDATDKWQYITHLTTFTGLRAMDTVKLECGTATSATLDCEYILVAKPNLIAIGDSLCSGANHFDPNPGVYAGDDDNSTTWMKHALIYRSKRNSLVVNKGIGGQTSSQILARIAEVTAHSPKVCFIQASSNDATGGVSQATRTSNVQSTIDACTTAGAKVVLLNAAYPNPNHASGATITAYNLDWWDNYRPSLTDVDLAIDIMEPLLSGGTMNPALTESDGIHPTAAGYQAIGEYMASFS